MHSMDKKGKEKITLPITVKDCKVSELGRCKRRFKLISEQKFRDLIHQSHIDKGGGKMRDFVIGLIKTGSQEMYERHGRVSPWRLTRSIHIGTEVIRGALLELGYVEKDKGNFVLKKAQGKAKAKEPKRLEDADISSFKVSNDIEFPNQDFIQDKEGMDYTPFSLNELRLIASNKGIKVAFSMTKGELIKKLKSKLK